MRPVDHAARRRARLVVAVLRWPVRVCVALTPLGKAGALLPPPSIHLPGWLVRNVVSTALWATR